MVVERLLDRVQLAVRRQPLDRGDLRAVDLDAEERARLRGRAVDEHRARAARRRVAPDVRARSARAAPAARRRGARAARAPARASCPFTVSATCRTQASLHRGFADTARSLDPIPPATDRQRTSTLPPVPEIREVNEDELDRWVAAMRTALDDDRHRRGLPRLEAAGARDGLAARAGTAPTSAARSGSAAGTRPRASPAARSASSAPHAAVGSARRCSPSSPPGRARTGTPS